MDVPIRVSECRPKTSTEAAELADNDILRTSGVVGYLGGRANLGTKMQQVMEKEVRYLRFHHRMMAKGRRLHRTQVRRRVDITLAEGTGPSRV